MHHLFKLIVALAMVVRAAHGQQITPERVALGRALFDSTLLSRDGRHSCATCHKPARAFTDGQILASGINGRVGQFNTPNPMASAFHALQFSNGRTIGASLQATQPLTNPNELGNASVNQVLNRLRSVPYFRRKFSENYRTGLTAQTFGHAIQCFEASLLHTDAPIDKRMAGYEFALSEQAERGFQIFSTSGCMNCHTYPTMTDGLFHNNGVIVATGDNDRGRVTIVPASQRRPEHVRARKTPTLREIARTAPYTHKGRIPTLVGIVDGYSRGWSSDPNKDRRIQSLNLDGQQRADLVAFLREGFSSPTFLGK